MAKPSYKIDLAAYIHLCETNYLRLLKLLPRTAHRRGYQLDVSRNGTADLMFSVKERNKFTNIVELELKSANQTLPDYHFDLRVYYDAAMVEVIAFQGRRQISPRYHYPNPNMHQCDEKYQQQQFLADCLGSCLAHGLGHLNQQSA